MLSSITPLGKRGHDGCGVIPAPWRRRRVHRSAGDRAARGDAGRGPAGTCLRRGHAWRGSVLCGWGDRRCDPRGRRLPSWRRQVNEDWLVGYRPWVVGGGFGLQLGAGVADGRDDRVDLRDVRPRAADWQCHRGCRGWRDVRFGTRLARAAAARSAATPAALARLHAAVAAWASRVRAATVALLAFGGLALLILGGG